MADDIGYTPGTGATIAADDIGGKLHQRVKLSLGADGAAADAPGDGTNGMLVHLGSNNQVTANAGTNLSTAALALEAGGNLDDIRAATEAAALLLDAVISGTELQVDVVTLPAVTLAAGTNTNEVVGDVAHDAAAAGNPLLVAGVAQAGDDTAPPNRVSAEGDATRLATDFDGAVYVRPHGPQIWSYHLDTSSAQTDAQVHAAPGAGLSLYVTSITFSSGSATAINLFFEEGSTKVLGPFYLEGVAGRGMHLVFPTPKKITPATALTLTTSASIAHSVDVCGFIGQG